MLALLVTLERRRFDPQSLLTTGAVAGPPTPWAVRRFGRRRPAAPTTGPEPTGSGTMVVLPARDTDVSHDVASALSDRPGPVMVMTLALCSPTRPDWSGDLGGAAWRNAVTITTQIGRDVEVRSRRGRLVDVARDFAGRDIGLIIVPGEVFPAAEVARLTRWAAAAAGLDLMVLGTGEQPVLVAPGDVTPDARAE